MKDAENMLKQSKIVENKVFSSFDNYALFCKNVENFMYKQKLSEFDLAKKANLPILLVSDILTMQADPSFKDMCKIADALGEPLHLFFLTPFQILLCCLHRYFPFYQMKID